MNTAKELIEYLSKFPGDTRVLISDWDCYNDEPSERAISKNPYVKQGKRKTIYL